MMMVCCCAGCIVLPASAILAARTEQKAWDLLYDNATRCSTGAMLCLCQALLVASGTAGLCAAGPRNQCINAIRLMIKDRITQE